LSNDEIDVVIAGYESGLDLDLNELSAAFDADRRTSRTDSCKEVSPADLVISQTNRSKKPSFSTPTAGHSPASPHTSTSTQRACGTGSARAASHFEHGRAVETPRFEAQIGSLTPSMRSAPLVRVHEGVDHAAFG
jgi:hypothetical protein